MVGAYKQQQRINSEDGGSSAEEHSTGTHGVNSKWFNINVDLTYKKIDAQM
jgi:hypothetical protein